VGKTHFTLALASVMGRPVHRHSFDSSHTGSALMGSDRNWGNTRTGRVFEAVCLGFRADPIMLLDELDKADSYRGGQAIAPLHSLLEPVTAGAVTDISAGITFNARHIFWIATANELWRLPPPILSRFRVFHILPPSARQALDLARAVAESVHERFASFGPPGRRIVALIAHLTPRDQIQALEQAYASALVNGRKQLHVQDLPADLQEADHGEGPATVLH
jgi:MoxR-like ATPase